MTIFNGTFTDDKPIYYPSTWETGKTAPELYEQWRLTLEYSILSNMVQCLIAGAWMCFVIVVLKAIYEMIRFISINSDCTGWMTITEKESPTDIILVRSL